jgi:hypothetical protein
MILELLIAWFATWLHHHQEQVIAYLRKGNRILSSRLSLTSRPEIWHQETEESPSYPILICMSRPR